MHICLHRNIAKAFQVSNPRFYKFGLYKFFFKTLPNLSHNIALLTL